MSADQRDQQELTIRPATADDCAAMVPIMAEMELHYFGEDAIEAPLIIERLAKWFADNQDTVILLALRADDVLGHAILAPLFPAGSLRTSWFLKDLYVAAKARGQGIGEHLIKACAAETVRRDGSRFDLTVDAGNDGADALYRRLGATDTRKTYLRWDGDNLARLAKS